MILFDLVLIPAASWPWGPPGAQPLDVLAVYGLIALLIGLIVWNAASAPKIADGIEPIARPTHEVAEDRTQLGTAIGAGQPGVTGATSAEPVLAAESSLPVSPVRSTPREGG